MQNTGLDKAQTEIKNSRRNINNLRYADDTNLMAESEEELKNLLMGMNEKSEKAGLKPNIQKTKIMASSPISSVQFSSVAQLCPTLHDPTNHSMPGIPVHHQLPSSLKLKFIELVMPSSHLILCHPLLLLPPIPPSIRVFSKESTLCMRWPKYWSFSFSICPPMNTQD